LYSVTPKDILATWCVGCAPLAAARRALLPPALTHAVPRPHRETLTFTQGQWFNKTLPDNLQAVEAIEQKIQASKQAKVRAGVRTPLDSTSYSPANVTPVTKKPRAAAEGISPAQGSGKQARVADKTKFAIHNEVLGLAPASALREKSLRVISSHASKVGRGQTGRS
jgi:hypothetical protein